MNDPRLHVLAKQLVNYSVELKAGEHLMINCTPDETPLAAALIKEAYAIGAHPHLHVSWPELTKDLLLELKAEGAEVMAEYGEARMAKMDAHINIATSRNPMESAQVPPENLRLYDAVVGQRTNKRRMTGETRWSIAIYPTSYYAYLAGMSLDDFTDYYFKVCCLDYMRLGEAMDVLKERLEATDVVEIIADGTDLSFSVKGINKRSSKGDRNIPDGEVYTAPVRHSVNGRIRFNVPSIFRGTRFENITLRFEDGKAVDGQCNDTPLLNAILDGDAGARYTGEFALGVNPYLARPIGLTLFDEKMNGSIHFAMGNALDYTDNGNRSAIHWDLVQSHRPEHGGGAVYFDGELVRQNGRFVLPELEPLNNTDF